MRTLLLCPFLLALSATAVAQSPDPTAPQRYEPLQVGYAWEYQAEFNSLPNRPYQSRLERRAILADTVIEGRRYFMDERQSFTVTLDGEEDYQSPTVLLVRFDPDRAHLVRWDGEADVNEGLACPLDAPFDGAVDCADGLPWSVFGGGGYKSFYDAVGAEYGVSYQRDVGLIEEGGDYVLMRLYYANVGAASFGTPRFVREVGAEPVAASVQHVGQAYPNPARESVAVTVRSNVPGWATLDAFDLLGRRVATEQAEVGGKGGTLELNSASWAPGLYLLRIRLPDGTTGTRRIVRAN